MRTQPRNCLVVQSVSAIDPTIAEKWDGSNNGQSSINRRTVAFTMAPKKRTGKTVQRKTRAGPRKRMCPNVYQLPHCSSCYIMLPHPIFSRHIHCLKPHEISTFNQWIMDCLTHLHENPISREKKTMFPRKPSH